MVSYHYSLTIYVGLCRSSLALRIASGLAMHTHCSLISSDKHFVKTLINISLLISVAVVIRWMWLLF